jgi:hypothetical protein
MSEEIIILDEKPFYIMIIKPGTINDLDWNNPDYVQSIVSKPFVKSELVNPSNFFESISTYLEIEKDDNSHLMTKCIGEEKDYIYEMIHVDTLNKDSKLQWNELASMLDMENEIIRGPVVLTKTYIPTLKNDISFEDMTSSELFKIIRNRGFTKIVIYDGDDAKLREDEFYGDLDKFAEKFFEGEYYKKKEMAFLAHNLNIYYTLSDYGNSKICGNLLSGKIDKCFFFSMLTDTIRANLTKDELNKIIELSSILEPPYKPEGKWYEEEKDVHGRRIIKNRFRILDNVYNENKK